MEDGTSYSVSLYRPKTTISPLFERLTSFLSIDRRLVPFQIVNLYRSKTGSPVRTPQHHHPDSPFQFVNLPSEDVVHHFFSICLSIMGSRFAEEDGGVWG
ncbi:hypothetical protein L6452_41014 [Arctium lappa]|uniref:Uncharacterized protein n=1 Tax=Arctium lappa TaxID=4217 RepID=A0ACB8XSE3_ARCLA|nr:hypothetical protein L6452_41014 [Arctium lappa]